MRHTRGYVFTIGVVKGMGNLGMELLVHSSCQY